MPDYEHPMLGRENKAPWWWPPIASVLLGAHVNISMAGLFYPALMHAAGKYGLVFRSFSHSGSLRKERAEEVLQALLDYAKKWKLDLVKAHPADCRTFRTPESGGRTFIGDAGALTIALDLGTKHHTVKLCDVEAYLLGEPEAWDELNALVDEYWQPPTGEDAVQVYMLLPSSSGQLQFTALPVPRGEPSLAKAYTPATWAALEKVGVALGSSSPPGRMILLHGPPGTGKSRWIRHLITHAPKARYLYLPSDTLSALNNSTLNYALNQLPKDGMPSVLILEDADAVLATRMADNMSALSALLNCTDGLPAEMFNLFAILTTNVPIKEIDDAVQRPGRVLAKVHMERLTPAVAVELVNELLAEKQLPPVDEKLGRLQTWRDRRGKTGSNQEGVALAEAYELARELGWEPPPAPPKEGIPAGVWRPAPERQLVEGGRAG